MLILPSTTGLIYYTISIMFKDSRDESVSVNSDVGVSMLQEYSLITFIAIQWPFCEDIMLRVIRSIPPDEKANSIILQLGDKRKTTYRSRTALLRASHRE